MGFETKYTLEEILIENSPFKSTNHLRKRLLAEGVFEHQCSNCLNREWLGSLIPLELEHRNGIRSDCRLENITLLCPNCHTLTTTYRGRKQKKFYFCGCGRKKCKRSKCCRSCATKLQHQKLVGSPGVDPD